eukprot:gene5102-34902_t
MRHLNCTSSTSRYSSVSRPKEFDLEARWSRARAKSKKLRIGLVGFGSFGQFLAKRLVLRGHTVMAYNAKEDYRKEAAALGVQYFSDADDFCEERPEVVMLCTSILSTQKVVESLPMQRLRRSTLIMDVLSVKRFPKMMLLKALPEDFDLICTHPMFGLASGGGSWAGLNFMYEKVRLKAGEPERKRRMDNLLQIFVDEGCSMVEMSCEEHDRQAASTQFVTHTVGRMLGAMNLQSTSINTKGYEALLQLVNQTNSLSFDLYYGLFLYNEHAVDDLESMEEAFEGVKKQLFGQLHDIARQQIFPDSMLKAERDNNISTEDDLKNSGP